MARPTDEKKDKTIKLRISADLYDELVKKGSNLSETIRKILKNEKDFVPQNKNPQKSSATPELRDIEAMCEVSGIDMEDFYSQIDGLMNEGTLDVSGGRVTVVLPDWAAEFAETCHDCSIPVEEAGKKAAKALRKGSI